jgi:hypothetical protein
MCFSFINKVISKGPHIFEGSECDRGMWEYSGGLTYPTSLNTMESLLMAHQQAVNYAQLRGFCSCRNMYSI